MAGATMYGANRFLLIATVLVALCFNSAAATKSKPKVVTDFLDPVAPNKTALSQMEVTQLIRNLLPCNGTDDGLVDPTFNGYPDHDALTKLLKDYDKQYPNITRLYSIGKSVQGRELWVMEISQETVHSGSLKKPTVKLIANIHGNEVTGKALLLMLIDYLLKNFKRSECIRQLISSVSIHILPCMNPDGFAVAVEGDIMSIRGRHNANDVDLNRNFPDQFDAANTSVVRQPETEAVMRWTQANRFILSASLHGGALVVTYPYDGTANNTNMYSRSPDDEVFRQISKSYSQAHAIMGLGNGCSRSPNERFKDGITSGAQWYSVKGGMQDWNYVYAGTFEVTLEVSCWKYPPVELMPEHWSSHRKALISFVLESLKGVRGFVLEANTNRTIRGASVIVKSIDYPVKSNAEGEYRRLLAPGNYTITVSKEGFLNSTRTVTVRENEIATFANFTLEAARSKTTKKSR